MVDRMSDKLGLSIFSFSVFHVFFEQYLTIARDSLHILGAHQWPVCGLEVNYLMSSFTSDHTQQATSDKLQCQASTS